MEVKNSNGDTVEVANLEKLAEQANDLGMSAPAGLAHDLLIQSIEGSAFNADQMCSLHAVLGFIKAFDEPLLPSPKAVTLNMHRLAGLIVGQMKSGEIQPTDLHS